MSLNPHLLWEYEETDPSPTASSMLNRLTESIGDSRAWHRGTAAERALLDPAPPGAYWQDTDGDEGLYSADPNGAWRQHEGIATVPAGAFTGSSPVLYRAQDITLPIVLSADETVQVTLETATYYSFVSCYGVVRGGSSTTIRLRHLQIANSTPDAVTVAWRIVKGI